MSQDLPDQTIALPAHTLLLREQYKVLRTLSQGGFGITYLALDSLEREVVVKECFASELCRREGIEVHAITPERAKDFESLKAHFKKEAYRLAALDHPGIVRVHQVFAENGTTYMAMDYHRGADLFTLSEETPERFDETSLTEILMQALAAVQFTHEQGFLHRDLAPDNIILDGLNHATLIDYGSAADLANQTATNSTRLLAVKDGYSPYEFYANGAAQDASSDLYSLGATFYYLIAGEAPPDSQTRLAAAASGDPDPFQPLSTAEHGISQEFLDPINHALAVHQKDRLRSAAEWLGQLATLDGAINTNAYPIPLSDIGKTISQLVSETNHGLARGMPKAMRDLQTKTVKTKTKSVKPAVPVDIFGNPIEDVDAYLREQDRLSKKKTKIKTKKRKGKRATAARKNRTKETQDAPAVQQ